MNIFSPNLKLLLLLLVCFAAYGYADMQPIAINTIEELQRIGNDEAYPLNGYYVLTHDIDASRTAWWDQGAGFDPIGQRLADDDSLAFNGWFDGQGYAIRGLVINRPESQGVGLFGSIGSNAVVVNLVLEGGSITGKHYVGALVGENWSQQVSACYTEIPVSGVSRVGGLAGINRGVLDSCTSTGDVAGTDYVGGLLGRNYEGIIQSCFSSGKVIGTHWTGGLIGESFFGETYDSFWDSVLSGRSISAGGIGLTTEDIAKL